MSTGQKPKNVLGKSCCIVSGIVCSPKKSIEEIIKDNNVKIVKVQNTPTRRNIFTTRESNRKLVLFNLEADNRFLRSANKLIKANVITPGILIGVLWLLSNNPSQNKLQTHKLNFRSEFASKIDLKYRLIWKYNKAKEVNTILLKDIGSHDNVYRP